MKLKVLGSSSKGNSYLLVSSTGQTLAIEAGVRLNEVKQAIGFDTSNIVGCLVSHEHGDHAKYIDQFCGAAIDVFTSEGTANCFKAHHRLHLLQSGVQKTIGEFKILPFDVVHDASEPFGFLINHPESGNILFLTDTFYSEYTFPNLSNIILEVNYDLEILERNISTGRLSPSIRGRVITNHMSLQTAKELLSANDLSKVNNIILIHLSDGNSHAENFKKDIEVATGKTVTIADAGTEINLNKTPF
ncbi:MAG TPA: MBL fold metallo-hydrolase [Prolixibacteraceae bacterium]|nr:MBL fold metallo-hydrolase [Prolixibacteraceae bacterium]